MSTQERPIASRHFHPRTLDPKAASQDYAYHLNPQTPWGRHLCALLQQGIELGHILDAYQRQPEAHYAPTLHRRAQRLAHIAATVQATTPPDLEPADNDLSTGALDLTHETLDACWIAIQRTAEP